MIHMYTKFEDDIFVRSSVIMRNVILSFIKEYRETTLRSLCDVIDDVITMKIFFLALFGMIFSFLISNWRCVLYLAFSKMATIWGRNFFFTWSDTGIWICYNDSHEHLWHFELLIDALDQILTELLEFKVLTYFGTLWRHQWSNPRSFVKAYLQLNDTKVHLVWRWYLCKFFNYHEKCYFLFIKEYRETTLRSFCDVIDDVITMKIFFLA